MTRPNESPHGRFSQPLRIAGESPNPAGPIALRPGRKQDIPAIEEIEHCSFAHPAEIFHRRQIRGLVVNPRAIVLVATDRTGGILGWAAALTRRHQRGLTGRIYALAVHPRSRGLGLGRKLIVRLAKTLKKRGAGNIYLEVRHDNHSAIALYRKLGFVDCQNLSHYYARDIHAIRMILSSKNNDAKTTHNR